MKEVHLITVGKLKDSNIESLEKDFLKRINTIAFKIHEVKARGEDLKAEANEVMSKLSSLDSSYPILLAENGKQRTSPDFSKFLFNLLEDNLKPVFIIGGAAGHGEEILKLAKAKISLGELTYPHKLARLLFVEQIYRAQTIHAGHPYHK